MSTLADLPSDLIDLLVAFENTGVEYLLVGGHAHRGGLKISWTRKT